MLPEIRDWRMEESSEWMAALTSNASKNKQTVQSMAEDDSLPLNYFAAYKPVTGNFFYLTGASCSSQWLPIISLSRSRLLRFVSASHPQREEFFASQIAEWAEKHDVIIVNEGANTMDIGRTMMKNFLPRRRLDAGTFGSISKNFSLIFLHCIHSFMYSLADAFTTSKFSFRF